MARSGMRMAKERQEEIDEARGAQEFRLLLENRNDRR